MNMPSPTYNAFRALSAGHMAPKKLGLDNGSMMVASDKRLALLPAKLGSLSGAD